MIGIFTFALMVRRSMLVGWYELLRDPRSIRFNKRYSGHAFVAVRKRLSGRSGRRLAESEEKKEPEKFRYFAAPETLEQPTFVLPDPEDSPGSRRMSVPEAGDVSKRHETTNFFESGEDEQGEEEIDEEILEIMGGKKGKGRKVMGDDERDLV